MEDPNTAVEAPQEHPETLGGTDPSVEASNAPEAEQAAAEVPAQEEATPAEEAPAEVREENKTTPAPVEAAHQYGASVNVEIDFEGHKVAHTFQISTEPLVDALNRFAKAKLGIDLVALEDQFKVFLNGVEVDHKQSSANLGVADGDTLKLHV